RHRESDALHDDALRILVRGADLDPAASRATRRAGTPVREHADLSERVRRPDNGDRTEIDPHPLEALPEVESIRRGIECVVRLDVAGRRVVLDDLRWRRAIDADRDRRWQRISVTRHDNGRRGDLRRGEPAGARAELLHPAAD